MKKQIIVVGVGMVIVFVLISVFVINTSKARYDIQFQDVVDERQAVEAGDVDSNDALIDEKSETIFVDVKGYVLKPGVYEVEPTLRVIDVIKLAGGLLEDANQNLINLSEKIVDEMVIYVPSITEEDVDDVVVSKQEANNDKLNINKASASELQTLPGIGNVKAEAIVAYRDEVGNFKAIEELMQVSGIGEKTFDGIKDLIKP